MKHLQAVIVQQYLAISESIRANDHIITLLHPGQISHYPSEPGLPSVQIPESEGLVLLTLVLVLVLLGLIADQLASPR